LSLVRLPCEPTYPVLQHEGVTQAQRDGLTGQKGCTVWFTGLSASGKSTLACALELALLEQGKRAFRLDGDNVRFGLNKDLGFSPADRTENIRRVGEVAKLVASSSTATLTAFISPYLADRQLAREIHDAAGIRFVEVFVDASLASVEARDPKGLYKKARAGVIKGQSIPTPARQGIGWEVVVDGFDFLSPEFTGISAPYEAPLNAEVHVKTDECDIPQGVQVIIDYLTKENLI